MRPNSGVSSEEFDQLVKQSRLKDIAKTPMTAKDMHLSNKILQTLKAKEVIAPRGRVRTYCRDYIIWGPGKNYNYHMDKWGWR